MHQYLGGIIKGKGGQSLCIGGIADHVHLSLVLPKTWAVADLTRDLKRASSIWIKERAPPMHGFEWQGGYGAFSVGQTESDVVKTYIQNQVKHHKTRSFQEEHRGLLDKYKIG